MSVHLFDGALAGLPAEAPLLAAVTVRLIQDGERERFDQELTTKHYLKNATVVGRVLRYVAEYQGQWVALVVFSSPALHLKLRDRWLRWSPRQVKERRHLVAQNSRFLVLAAPGQWPNLASRVLKLACQRLPQDWQEQFGYPVQVAETFVDPQRFRGTCYKAAGWQRLGPTLGFERHWQDFYTDTQHPKELWVRPLGERALEQVGAPELPLALVNPQGPLPPACPVPTARLDSLWERFQQGLTDPRKPRGVRHKLAGCFSLIALGWRPAAKGHMPSPNLQTASTIPNAAACAADPDRANLANTTCPRNGPSVGCSKRSIPSNSKRCWWAGCKPRIRRHCGSCMRTAKWSKTPNRLRPGPRPRRCRPPRQSPVKSRPNSKSPKPTRP